MCIPSLQNAKVSKRFSALALPDPLEHEPWMREMAEKMGLPSPAPTPHKSTYIPRRGI